MHNTGLLETPTFIVIPSVGPLMRGHVMVVSKTHSESLAVMGQDALVEYNALAARLRNAPLLKDTDPLEAEHGSTIRDKAGACVVHAHVHWLPGMGQYLNELQSCLTVLPDASLAEFSDGHEPYIFARNGTRHAIFEARGLPSQTIRRILCGVLDREDTDWTQAHRLDLVKETVEAWREQVGP
jgi:diadenosine tetraphosphate (Ap4A) HIT family hydrolase